MYVALAGLELTVKTRLPLCSEIGLRLCLCRVGLKVLPPLRLRELIFVMCTFACASCAQVCAGAPRGQKRTGDAPKLDLRQL